MLISLAIRTLSNVRPVIEADYTDAITMLTHFKLPPSKEGLRSLVRDACHLSKNQNVETGADIVQHYSGQRPKVNGTDEERSYTPFSIQQRQNAKRWSHTRSSPSMSPARKSTPQKQLENLLTEVSGSLQRRTEGWSVSKAVRGAVGEVRRNVNNLQTSHSREASVDTTSRMVEEQNQVLGSRLSNLEARNKALAKMLDTALSSLRACKPGGGGSATNTEDVFNMALARIQFVSVYLADSEIRIPQDEDTEQSKSETNQILDSSIGGGKSSPLPASSEDSVPEKSDTATIAEAEQETDTPPNKELPLKSSRANVRPSLADSSFSFMLGENRHRSSFVSSVTTLPEQRRDSDASSRPAQLWENDKEKKDRQKIDRDDGFTMSSLR